MNVKSRPLLIAAGVGAVIELIVVAILQTLNYFAMPAIASARPGMGPLFGGAGLVACLCGLLLDFGAGALYVFLFRREEAPAAGEAALGGGAAAASARGVSGLLGLCAGLLLLPVMMRRMRFGGLPEEGFGPATAMGMAGGLVGGVVGLVVALIFSALLGAAGAATAAAIRGRSSGEAAGGAGLL